MVFPDPSRRPPPYGSNDDVDSGEEDADSWLLGEIDSEAFYKDEEELSGTWVWGVKGVVVIDNVVGDSK